MLAPAHICSVASSCPGRVTLRGFVPCFLALCSAGAWITANPTPATVLLLALLALSVVNYYLGSRDILYPAFTFTAVWSMAVAVYCFYPMEIDRISWSTLSVFLGGAGSFSVGSLVGNRPLTRQTPRYPKRPTSEWQDNPQARIVLLVYSLLVFPLFAFDTVRIGGAISLSPTFFINLRENIIASSMDNVSTVYSNKIISTAPMITVLTLFVLVMEEKRRWTIWICALCVVAYSLLMTGRGLFMQMLCGWTLLAVMKSKDRRLGKMSKKLLIPALIAVALMSLMTLLTKLDTQGSDGLEVAGTLTVKYVTGPIAGFDYLVRHPNMFKGQSVSTLEEVLTPLSKLLGFRYEAPPVVQPSVSIPFPTNLYTCYGPYYEDFGLTGCLVAFALFGVVEGHVFYGAIHGSRVSAFILAYLSYALMLSIFGDSYHLLVRYLYVGCYSLAYFCVLSRIRLRIGGRTEQA